MKYIGIKWIYKPNGNCPVQSEGWFLGWYFYFRARWSRATIEFSESEILWDSDARKQYVLKNTDYGEAGWLGYRTCIYLIYKGCFLFSLYLLNIKFKKLCKQLKLMLSNKK